MDRLIDRRIEIEIEVIRIDIDIEIDRVHTYALSRSYSQHSCSFDGGFQHVYV